MASSSVDSEVPARRTVPEAARKRPKTGTASSEGAADVCNEVRLVGRLTGEPELRELPSGDVLVVFKVVVDRPPPARALPEGVRAVTVDTLPCVAWSGAVRRTVSSWASGDVVEVSGALRRRFWRTGAGAASQTEVEVLRARRLARADRDA